MKYDQIEDGDEFFIENGQPLDLACCDCHLAHRIEFRKVRGGIMVKISRVERITAALRQGKKDK